MSLHRIESADELHRHLHAALQLEHATIPPYLTALYSIHPGANPEARQIIRAVVVEEMLHLTLAANILNAVGGKPDLTAPGFVPAFPAHLPDGEEDFEVGLRRFSPEAVETFLSIERPAEATGEGVRTVRRAPASNPLGAARADDGEEHFYSIGEFYQAVEQGLETLHARMGDALFCGDPARQVGPEMYYSGGGGLTTVTDLASAKAALDLIAEQGEGVSGAIFDEDGEIAHYYRFQQLVLGRYYEPGDAPGAPSGGPVPVDWDAVFPIRTDARVADYPQGSELRAAAEAFNRGYASFLALVTRAFDGEPRLLVEGMAGMFRVKDEMGRLMRTPLGDGSGLHAAPTFEMPATVAAAARMEAAE